MVDRKSKERRARVLALVAEASHVAGWVATKADSERRLVAAGAK